MTTPAADQEPAAVDDDLFEPGWDRPKRTNRLTVVLVGGLIAALAFTGGVAVQKKHDAGLVGGGGGAAFAAAAGARGARGAGGFGGTGGTAGATPTPSETAPEGAAPAGPGAAPAAVPVAVGTVRSLAGTTLTITNFAGKVITVNVPPTATVTTPGLGGLAVGMPVSVSGTTGADGVITATSLISRKVDG
ncbi:hypothetical protein [Pseudonocardia sp. GCM10023141]|uniref:hypothetical protein n=1 Tax=Pseudonocardia sp. GCM10023141 TaxID=3252653 RepID=UPI00361C27B4